MNLQSKITAKHRNSYTLLGGVQTFRKERALNPSLKLKSYLYAVNPLTPIDIIDTKWNKWNEPDEIIYQSVSGAKYSVTHEKLLPDITGYMKQNRMRGLLPYLHIEAEDGWECLPRPANDQIVKFLQAYLCNYDIYSVNGDLVQEANNEKRGFTLCVELD